MIDVLNQNLGRRPGKVARGMGKARVRETGAPSSRSNTAEVDVLKEEVTQLKAQLRVQGKEMKTCVGTVRDLVQAIQMSGLQISLPTTHLTPPSTSEPPRPADT